MVLVLGMGGARVTGKGTLGSWQLDRGNFKSGFDRQALASILVGVERVHLRIQV